MKCFFRIVGFLLLLLFSCKKAETVDETTKYVGNFSFVVVESHWSINANGNWKDTLTYDGTIKLYADGDNLHDLSSFDSIKNPNQRFSIEFLDNISITPEISESGLLREVFTNHYYHSGKFSNNNQIEFNAGLGGLGGGIGYSVKGLRKK